MPMNIKVQETMLC